MARKKKKPKRRDPLAHIAAPIKKEFSRHGRVKLRIEQLIKKWKRKLWLGQWRIDVLWEWNGIDGEAAATVNADWKYMIATLKFDLPYCSTLKPDVLLNVIVHELVHLIVNEMREDGVDHEERVVSHITSILVHD